jgi:hypothetical protein
MTPKAVSSSRMRTRRVLWLSLVALLLALQAAPPAGAAKRPESLWRFIESYCGLA